MDRRDSGLIVPGRLKVHERNAPPAKFGAGIAGWVDWALIDRNGRTAQAGQSSNMWLNQGLNELAIPASGSASILGRGNSAGSGVALFGVTHVAVGTDTTAVSPTDTALGSELARSSTVLSGSVDQTRLSDGVYHLTKTWVFDFGQANGNLTEWGVARASSLGLLTRALFVDVSDNPITITKTSDYQLRLAYTLEVILTPVTPQPASILITGVGTINGEARLMAGVQGTGMNDFIFFVDWAAGGSNPRAAVSTNTEFNYTDNVAHVAAAQSNSNTPAAYVSGTYQRTCSHVWGVSNGNVNGIRTIAGLGGPFSAWRISGFTFLIDPGDAFDKTSVNQLVLNDLFTVSWARA